MREFVQTHVILAILRVCWGGSVLQLLTPDPLNPVNLVNPLTNSTLRKNNVFTVKASPDPPTSPSGESGDECQVVQKPHVFTVKASPDPPKSPSSESARIRNRTEPNRAKYGTAANHSEPNTEPQRTKSSQMRASVSPAPAINKKSGGGKYTLGVAEAPQNYPSQVLAIVPPGL